MAALLVFIPATLLYIRLVRKKLQSYGEKENKARHQQSRAVLEIFRGYTDVEISNAFPSMFKRFDSSIQTIARINEKTDLVKMIPSIFTELSVAIAMVGLVLYGLFGGFETDIKVTFGIFAVATMKIMPSIRNIMSMWWSIRYNRYTIEIVREACPNNKYLPIERETQRMNFGEQIQISGLWFRYEDAEQESWTIKDMNFTIKKGEKVGIRGVSGAGKTTFFNLLLGFFVPTKGEILIDGEPLTRSNVRLWQNAIGYVSQNIYIEDSTMLQNIAMGIDSDEIDRAKVDEVLRIAKLDEMVASLPNGVDTAIGEFGSRLSGGQKQRIGIARALYKQADILFFDEATSSLDNQTENDINNAIQELYQRNSNMTIVVIAHRESSLNYCTKILDI